MFALEQNNTLYIGLISDCSDGKIPGSPGIHLVSPGSDAFVVYCQAEAGHNWTVIQRRVDDSVNFYRNWADYRAGFGEIGGDTNLW